MGGSHRKSYLIVYSKYKRSVKESGDWWPSPTQQVHCKTCKAGPIHAKESLGRCSEKEESPVAFAL